ncbi:PAQR family membrane homeostasis protein TrhA [Chryseolinea lacunae]|uniref:Hemolysin III family protein n=1 Tax=Chryseolinea lacunae TaxID=2801331 RepID=A0ABS1KR13_9BACT|nr:hemolysin III family protein [Chryseolinea lacunae]MBL0741657.1 hemolysin III family protein [Chryseolinea lacunae]
MQPLEHPRVSIAEEIANAITHGVGALLAIAALVLLVVFASLYGTAWHVVGFSVFGAMLVILYVMSTLYHSLMGPRVKKLFRKFDHMAIFLLIAGTYTPFCLTALRGWMGWTVLGVVWCCAIAGVVMKAFHTGKAEWISTVLYVVMGWAVVAVIKPVYTSLSFEGFLFLVLGGASYTLGVFFFVKDKMKYSHSIWHLFVLGGSTFHFFAVMSLL